MTRHMDFPRITWKLITNPAPICGAVRARSGKGSVHCEMPAGHVSDSPEFPIYHMGRDRRGAWHQWQAEPTPKLKNVEAL